MEIKSGPVRDYQYLVLCIALVNSVSAFSILQMKTAGEGGRINSLTSRGRAESREAIPFFPGYWIQMNVAFYFF